MTPGSFSGPVRVERVWEGRDLWVLLEPIAYCTQAGRVLHVRAGTLTDFATIPRVLWPVLSPTDHGLIRPAIIHDYTYEFAELLDVDRGWCDRVLGESMAIDGVHRLKRWAVYAGVRLGGHWAWERYRNNF